MIVLSRFQVPSAATPAFVERARAAVSLLGERDGNLSADFARNIDEPELWTITTRWRNVGSYRRALQGYESKMVIVPLLSLAIDEPSAYEDADLVGENQARGSQPGST